MKKIFNLLNVLWTLFFSLLMIAPSAFAQEDSPDAMIKSVTEEVLSIVRQDKDIQSGNTQKAINLVETKVLPHFNFQRMTSLAVGRDWNKANAEQKKRLTEEFKTLLVRTYSNALTGYRNQTVRYRPTRMQAGDTEVVVKSEILQPGNKPIQLQYSVERQNEGWKVYDVVVAGVSLVSNYRSTFNQEVSANGIDGLIKMLVDKNQQNNPNKQ
ncbi:MlaC/ttg2D family ABC transporter substrate-binding protein [Dentiradicibacter hellwigii]|uniref:ABC transporter substrate-binding protein n=1 Tax=Dentiradicibacter hellwigii TaxID=3149053 RepID=A0ABV4UBI4_9RHOO